MGCRPLRVDVIRRGARRTGLSRPATPISSSSRSPIARPRVGQPLGNGLPLRLPDARLAGPFERTRSMPSGHRLGQPVDRVLESIRECSHHVAQRGPRHPDTRVQAPVRHPAGRRRAVAWSRGRQPSGRPGNAEAVVGSCRSRTPRRLARRPRSTDRCDGSIRDVRDHPDARTRGLHARVTLAHAE